MNMSDGPEHLQLLDRLDKLKQTLEEKFANLDKGLAINTVKTSNVEGKVDKLEMQLNDLGKAFITHSEYEVRHKALQEEINDHERRIRILENFKSIIFGGLVLSNIAIVPILIWLVIKQLN